MHYIRPRLQPGLVQVCPGLWATVPLSVSAAKMLMLAAYSADWSDFCKITDFIGLAAYAQPHRHPNGTPAYDQCTTADEIATNAELHELEHCLSENQCQ